MIAAQRAVTRLRHLPRLLSPRHALPNDVYLGQLGRLYAAIETVAGCSIIVDSSKLPSYGFVLGQVSNIDVRVVHLVRDPRGTAYSWSKSKAREDDDGDMQRMSVVKSSALWLAWNAAAPALFRGRSMLVRYEDLVADPRPVVDSILAFAGHDAGGAPFLDERTVSLGTSHTVAGNPDRLRAGPVQVRLDQAWTREMARPQRALVTAMTTPLLGRYDYPLGVKQ
jgi:hypothetical protein